MLVFSIMTPANIKQTENHSLFRLFFLLVYSLHLSLAINLILQRPNTLNLIAINFVLKQSYKLF